MERVSEIISKKIIVINKGAYFGYVKNVLLNLKRMSIYGFFIFNEENNEINFVQFKNIKIINDYIVLKNANMLSFVEENNNSPINKFLISTDGIDLGKIIDIEIEKNKIIKLITNKNAVYAKDIYLWDGDFLVYSEKRKRRRLNTFSELKKEREVKVEIQSEKQEIKPIFINQIKGRIATVDIFGYNNELIIKKNEIVTERIICLAKKHNKLNYLMMNIK